MNLTSTRRLIIGKIVVNPEDATPTRMEIEDIWAQVKTRSKCRYGTARSDSYLYANSFFIIVIETSIYACCYFNRDFWVFFGVLYSVRKKDTKLEKIQTLYCMKRKKKKSTFVRQVSRQFMLSYTRT